jgi:Inner membrane protein YgaP-like, transmembrane domain
MKRPFTPNITGKGRIVRGVWALLIFIGAGFGSTVSIWLGLLLGVSGAFVLFEAVRGWCVLRACGVKTRF